MEVSLFGRGFTQILLNDNVVLKVNKMLGLYQSWSNHYLYSQLKINWCKSKGNCLYNHVKMAWVQNGRSAVAIASTPVSKPTWTLVCFLTHPFFDHLWTCCDFYLLDISQTSVSTQLRPAGIYLELTAKKTLENC